MTYYKTKNPYIDAYVSDVLDEKVLTNRWIKLACRMVLKSLNQPNIIIEHEKIETAIQLGEKFFYNLFPWQKFVIGLIHCYEKLDGITIPVWNRFDLIMGRGSGKNGFISFLIWYFTTPYHGIDNYHVDLVANSEDQAKRSFVDAYDVLAKHELVMDKQFEWTKTLIKNTLTGSTIEYNTSNSRTKDSKRTGCVVFDEIHEYENYKEMTVYQSGLGKTPHPRQFVSSSFGYVREGVFDQELEKNKAILEEKRPMNRRLPLIYALEDVEQAKDPDNWVMSVPSLPYFPMLQIEMTAQWDDAQDTPEVMMEFMTKRMGLPAENRDLVVTEWKNIVAASRPLPDLKGRECVFGIDYASTTDFVSAGLLFKDNDEYFWIKKTWVCKNSKDIPRIKAPLSAWNEQGFIEIVDAVEIHPTLVTDWLFRMSKDYKIIHGAMDGFRFTLLAKYLSEIGFEPGRDGNLKLTRGNDIIKAQPVISSVFTNHNLAFGDDPEMRWAINNAKKISYGRDKDLGNFTYGKQEPKSRKTDSFQAMVHAFTIEDLLDDNSFSGVSAPIITW